MKLHKVYKSSGSAVGDIIGDINIHQGYQAAIQGVTGQTKFNNLLCASWLYINTRVQNDRARHDEYLLDLDQVAGCCQPSNLSSDFPLGSRKFSSYY